MWGSYTAMLLWFGSMKHLRGKAHCKSKVFVTDHRYPTTTPSRCREGSLNQKQAQLCTLSNQSQLILTLITFSCFGINKINRCTRGEQWDDYKQTSLGQPEDPASSSGAQSAFALEDQSLMVHYWCPVLFIVKFQRYKVIEE